MKELWILDEPKREIEFCQKYSNRCFMHCYGFIKKEGAVKAIIYEYMCNGTLTEYIEKIDPVFSLLTVTRLFEGLEFLYSKRLVHRDLKPTNILLDHNFLPYISDFETIRDPQTDEPMTCNLGSLLYSSPEQDKNEFISFPTDIYSFGLIIYFLYEKKNFHSHNPYKKALNHEIIDLSPECKITENFRNLYKKCVEPLQNKRPKQDEIKSVIIKEINKFNFLDLSKDEDQSMRIRLIELIYENSIIQRENRDEFIKWTFNILKIYFNTHKNEYKSYYSNQDNSDMLLNIGFMYAEGQRVEQNFLKAKEYFELSAKLGNSNALYNLGCLYDEGLGVEQNYLKAKEYYELAAKKNNPGAFLNLGKLYAEGHGIKKDYVKAIKYFELSAKQNESDALYNLGLFYYKGFGVKSNYLKAKEYFESSAKQGNCNSLLKLGYFYDQGLGVEQNYLKAKEYYELAAKQGNSDALYNLGLYYYMGLGVEPNYVRAREYFEISAQRNNSEALYNLGVFYFKGLGVKQNYLKAKEFLELSAKQGNSNALLKLGYIYAKGYGVEQNYQKAKEYFELSAKKGNSDALFKLGYFYSEGLGVEPNYLKAKEYLELSAEQNHSDALFDLGCIYSRGQGVERNYLKAKEYFELSAKQNNSNALIELGHIYESGLGVPKDHLRAKYYYELSAKQNNSNAFIKLAFFYFRQNEDSNNLSKMKELLEKAADCKNPNAFYSLGDVYYYGIGVEKNYEKAMKYYEKAANSNISAAYYQIGRMNFNGNGVKQDLVKALKYYEYSAQLNNKEALFTLGDIYSTGYFIEMDIPRAIQYLKKCKENRYETIHAYIPDIFAHYKNNKYNYFYYRSMNDLGLIYLTDLNDRDKAIENIKEAAFGEYPFGQNNYGLLYQFYLNNLDNAEYYFKRSSKHKFALAEYNLGYLKEKEGKLKESIDYYIQASEHQNIPLEFLSVIHIDKRLNISKLFILFYVNLKLAVYFYQERNIVECRKYMIRSFTKFIDQNNCFIQKTFKRILDAKENSFSFLKFMVFCYPEFNFINQPNLISQKELIDIIIHSNIILKEGRMQQENGFSDDDNKGIKKNDGKVKNVFDEFFNEIIEKRLTQADIDYIHLKEITEVENFKSNEKEDRPIENNGYQNEINNLSERIFKDLGEMLDFIINDSNFLNEMSEIIEMVHKMLYKPPYDILFGRTSIAERKPMDLNHNRNISQAFYEGLQI